MGNTLRSDELQSVVGSTLKPDEIRMKWFMNLIDYQDARPIYEQICDGYKALILKKVMLPNDPMPSVRSLAVDLVDKSQHRAEGFLGTRTAGIHLYGER